MTGFFKKFYNNNIMEYQKCGKAIYKKQLSLRELKNSFKHSCVITEKTLQY